MLTERVTDIYIYSCYQLVVFWSEQHARRHQVDNKTARHSNTGKKYLVQQPFENLKIIIRNENISHVKYSSKTLGFGLFTITVKPRIRVVLLN